MDRRTAAAFFMAFIAGVAVTATLVSPPRALADGSAKGAPHTFIYYPAANGNPAELLDSRNGAIYKRNDTSSRWDLQLKPLDQE